MESPVLIADSAISRPRFTDLLILGLFCVLLYGSSLLTPRILTSHETTHCLNVREMMESGEWLIPTYGGRPWLERPPAPHWMTAIGVAAAGRLPPEISYRLSSIAIATLAVLIFSWCMGGCFGRHFGLMAGAILATMQEFAAYAVGPEADIFLASTVTIAGSLLARTLFDPVYADRYTSFVGRRSLATLLFFVLLGGMNAMKGPLFGMFFVVLPTGAFFLWTRQLATIRPLLWLWGWVLTLGLGLLWPAIAYWRYPDIVDLWAIDYGVRWRAGYLGEPSWYYLVQQPWNMFPWTIPAFIGLGATARLVFTQKVPIWRFLWCWSLVPIVFFSLFKGKHHHYMLSCLAPAAALAAMGAQRFWCWMRKQPDWLRRPWLAVPLIGVPGSIAVYVFRAKIPGPPWVISGFMIFWPCMVLALWWMAGRRSPRTAFAGVCVGFFILHFVVYEYRTLYAEEYVDDLAFIHRIAPLAAPGKPLYVLGEFDPLNPSWTLFYLAGRGQLLHNDSYLRDERITARDVLVVCRERYRDFLVEYGTTEEIDQSVRARYERSHGDRYTLYKLTFAPDLRRVPANVRMTPLQATGRDLGPYLDKRGAIETAQSR